MHSLPFPTTQEELLNLVVDRKVSARQKVIKLARVVRQRRGIYLKSPLILFVVIGEPEFISEVASLMSYVTKELNDREGTVTSNEKEVNSYNIHLEAKVHWPTLGKRLKKHVQIVRNAPSLVHNPPRFIPELPIC